MGNTVSNTVTLWMRAGQRGTGDHGATSKVVHKGEFESKSNTEVCKNEGRHNGGESVWFMRRWAYS